MHSKNKNKRILVTSFIASLMLASCGSTFQSISSNYDHATDFQTFKTYAWLDKHLPHSETPFDNEIVENNIKNYVDKELESRNLTANADLPDLLFELVLNDKEKISTSIVPVYNSYQSYSYPATSYRYYNGKNYRWNQHGYSNRNYAKPSYQIGSRAIKTAYNRSTITVNVFDRVKNQLVWTGSAKGNVYDDNYKQSDIHPAIVKILNRYPIKATYSNKVL